MVAQTVKNLPAMQETRVRSLGWEDPLEEQPTPVLLPGESQERLPLWLLFWVCVQLKLGSGAGLELLYCHASRPAHTSFGKTAIVRQKDSHC